MSSFANFPKSVVQKLILNPAFKVCNFIDFKKCMSYPEYAHDEMTNWIKRNPDSKLAHSLFEMLSYKSNNLHYTRKNQYKDLEFDNPIIYAAGSNKYADGANYFDKSFGGLMIGGITKEARVGNGYKDVGGDLIRSDALRMTKDGKGSGLNGFGLNNLGAAATAEKITQQKKNGLWTQKPIGINVAAGAGDMEKDYPNIVETLYEHGDFFELNFSCPNHQGLAEIHNNVEKIRATIKAVKKINVANKPIVVKFGILSNTPDDINTAQDLTYDSLKALIEMCIEELDENQDKINITNTAKEHTTYDQNKKLEGLQDIKGNTIAGGVSGKLIQDRSLQTVQFVKKILDKNVSKLGIIGTGGIGCDEAGQTGKQLIAMKDAGAELFNMFTGFVYNPTSLANNLRALDKNLRQ